MPSGLFGKAGEHAPRPVEGGDVVRRLMAVAEAQRGARPHVVRQHHETRTEPWCTAVLVEKHVERAVHRVLERGRLDIVVGATEELSLESLPLAA